MSSDTPGNPLADLQQPAALPSTLDLSHDFRVVEVRRGGMGEVRICVLDDGDPQQRFALKSFQKRFFFDPETRRAFLREVGIWARLAAVPYVMPVAGLTHIDDRPFVVMPACEESLRDVLELSVPHAELALRSALQIALGMRAAAARLDDLVHGDLKPENILIGPSGLLISDFGLARAAGVVTEQLEGTWAYRAPELWQDTPTSVAGDIYAYGTIVYEALCGRKPFVAHTRDEWARAHLHEAPAPTDAGEGDPVHAALLALALRCLEKAPGLRPASFADVVTELRRVLDEDPVGALMLMVEFRQTTERLEALRPDLTSVVVRMLLAIGELDLALEEIEAIPSDERSAFLLCQYGDVLSELGRDEEAIEAFERALALGLDDSGRIDCLSSYALSLKHLERYDEALDVYFRLLGEVPEDAVSAIVSNLGTVYLEQGEPESAVSILERRAQLDGLQPELWANLALAYEQLGRFSKAAETMRRALTVAPQRGDLQTHLARILVRQGEVAQALGAVEAAYDQGVSSQEWLVVAQAALRLSGHDAAADELTAIARRDLDADTAAALQRRVDELVGEAARG